MAADGVTQDAEMAPSYPRRTAIDIPPEETNSTVTSVSRRLLGGYLVHTARDLAMRTGTDLDTVKDFCIALGFPVRDDDALAFSQRDLGVYAAWTDMVESGDLSPATSRSLLRANAYLADRLALWQVEALVEEAVLTHQLDDTSARMYVLDHMRDRVPVFERMLTHAWQRHLDALLTRTEKEISQRDTERKLERFPLNRSLGFVDMVSYTSSAAFMGEALVDLIQRFEEASRVAVTEAGGRVVKMIGDAVLYIADDLRTGLAVATALIERLGADEEMLPVRASFVRGDVFSRSGDVFGPTVNLAARPVDIAPVGKILTDPETARAIVDECGADGFTVEEMATTELRGFGQVSPYLVSVPR